MKPLLIDIFKNYNKLSGIDIIYTLLTLHHIKDTGKIFEIFNTLLSPGGYICIGDLITEDGSFHHKDPEFDGHKGFDTAVLKTQLIENSFVIEYEKIFSIIEKKYPMFLIIGKKVNMVR
jgi:hypothetical protein